MCKQYFPIINQGLELQNFNSIFLNDVCFLFVWNVIKMCFLSLMGKKIIPIHKNHKQDLLGNNMSCTLTFGFCSFKFLFGLFFFFNFSLNFLPIYSSISKRWKFQSLPIFFSMVCELIIKWDSCWSYLQFKSGYKGLIGKG